MQISDNDRLVLGWMQLRATAPLPEIQKLTGLRPHTIRYCLKRAMDRGIAKAYTLLNVYPLGFNKFGVFFSFATEDPSVRKRSLDELVAMKSVVSVLEIFGDYEYFISIAAPGVHALAEVLEEISSRIGDVFLQKAFAARVALTLYQRSYLLGSCAGRGFIKYEMTGERYELSNDDMKIIDCLDQGGTPSLGEIARSCRIPASTVNYRLRRLKENGIICGHLLSINPRLLGMSTIDVLVSTKGIGGARKAEMHEICLGHPNIVGLAYCIGTWDYEIRVELEDPHQIIEITNLIRNRLGNSVNEIKTVSIFNELKYMRAPLFDEKELAGAELMVANTRR